MNADLMVAAIAALSRTATAEFAVEDMLRALCEAAAQSLEIDGAGVMLCEGSRNVFVHSSTPRVQPVELLQEALQRGPCADAVASLAPVVVEDLTRGGRWPEFQAMARDTDLGGAVAIPLVSRGQGWGVLDLYRESVGAWGVDEVEAAGALADVAASYIVMAHDREGARSAHKELAHRATHDDLTGLPNRALLFDRIDHAIATAARAGGAVAVVFLDLDLFKDINDTFGHAIADNLLVEVAQRLSATLRGTDTLARFAGDEFVLLCEGLPDEPPDRLAQRMSTLTDRLLRVMQAPIPIGGEGNQVVISASMGVAITTDQPTSQELVADADAAMYAAKKRGRGRVTVRDHTTENPLSYAGQLERDLAQALDREEFAVHYQPIVDAGTRQLAAVEALLRWNHPSAVTLESVAFIDLANRTGMIVSIGRWVLQQTCRQLREWLDETDGLLPALAYVNISARELADPGLPVVIKMALEDNGLSPANLGLEVVEEDFADPVVVKRLTDLQQAGHPLSVDDFGTGYSSLSRLLDLPVAVAKVDRSFVAGLPDDDRRRRLVEGVILIAGHLDIDVVAEGVETQEQADYLTSAGCQLLQGRYIGPPQSAADLAVEWTRH